MEWQNLSRQFRNNRNDAGSLLASTFIVAMGAGCIFFMLMAMSPGTRPNLITVCCGVSVVVLLLTMRLRIRTRSAWTLPFLYVLGRSHRDDGLACQYEPKKIKRSRGAAAASSNQPISVEELREIQTTSANTWVPARGRNGAKSA
jgi:hypothetical protein